MNWTSGGGLTSPEGEDCADKCLLLVHAGTLFSVVRPAIRKADLRNLAALVAAMIGAELEREGLPHNTYGALAPPALTVAKTANAPTAGNRNGGRRTSAVNTESAATATSRVRCARWGETSPA